MGGRENDSVIKSTSCKTGGMAQQLNTLTALPKDLSSIPSTNMVTQYGVCNSSSRGFI